MGAGSESTELGADVGLVAPVVAVRALVGLAVVSLPAVEGLPTVVVGLRFGFPSPIWSASIPPELVSVPSPPEGSSSVKVPAEEDEVPSASRQAPSDDVTTNTAAKKTGRSILGKGNGDGTVHVHCLRQICRPPASTAAGVDQARVCRGATMIVGVPTETKTLERRVAISAAGVVELCAAGHEVVVERGAGAGSGISDETFLGAGAEVGSVDEVYERAQLILHVKEPQERDLTRLGPQHVLFTYLHLAAYPQVAADLLRCGATALAYETVQLPDGHLPLLAPMSRIAGRMAMQAGAHYLEAPQGGKGMLAGGIPGVARAKVAVLGAGVSGWHAIDVAVGMGAAVTVLDISLAKLEAVEMMWGGRVETIHSSRHGIEAAVTASDVVIGAVLVAGDRSPILVEESMIAAMEAGSVVVDISIDQGGCFATSRETSHTDPVYVEHGVVHYAVGNIPGAVPRTSTLALTNATMRYAVALAGGLPAALARYPELALGVNVVAGKLTNAAVAHGLGQSAVPLEVALG